MKARLWSHWLAGLGLVAVGSTFAPAQDIQPAGGIFRRAAVPCPCPNPLPVAPCPVVPYSVPYTMPGVPTDPNAPVNPTMPTDPNAAQTPQAPGTLPPIENPPASNFSDAAFTQAPSAGTGGGASIAPNLMGDLFGGRSAIITIERQLTTTFPNSVIQPGGVLVSPGGGNVVLSPLQGQRGDTSSPFQLNQIGRIDPFVQPLLPGQTVITQQQGEAARAILQTLLSTRGLTPAQLALVPPNLRSQILANQNQLNQAMSAATHGIPVPLVNVGPVTGVLGQNGNVVYSTVLSGQTVVAIPGAGSTVGRIKMSEDNNPLPRDRFIFNYDYFDNVPFSINSLNVNRFQFGIEKTFLGGRWSAEFRLPFASTLTSSYTVGMEGTNTQLGNVRFALKRLWTRNPNAAVRFASGVGVTLPTADDLTTYGAGGTQLVRFQNNSVQVEPYIAMLLTPTDRLFGQVWSSVNFDTGGSKIYWNRAAFGGSGSTQFFDVPVLAVDGQIGYWVYKSQTNRLRGLAPFLELHYNYAIAQDQIMDAVQGELRSRGLQIDATAGTEFNLTAGVTSQIGDNLLVTLGGSAPLLKRPDRTFDGQFGIRVNYLFGPTAARARTNPGYYVNSY